MFVTRFILSTNTCRTFICLYYLMLNTIWPTWGREKQLMKQKHYKLLKIKWQLRNNVQQAKKKNNIYCKVLQYQPLVDTQSRHREHNTLKICGAVYKTSSHHFWIYSQKWPSEMESKTITHSTTNWIMWSWKMILLTLVVPFLFTVFVFCFFADLPFCTSGSSDAVGSGTITQSKHKGYETAMCRKLWGQCDTCMHVSILLFYGGKCWSITGRFVVPFQVEKATCGLYKLLCLFLFDGRVQKPGHPSDTQETSGIFGWRTFAKFS